jgi:hypothetical protein
VALDTTQVAVITTWTLNDPVAVVALALLNPKEKHAAKIAAGKCRILISPSAIAGQGMMRTPQ